MQQLVEYKTYNDFKEEFSAELTKAAGSFVKIGYLCKVARDTDILAESPYDNLVDFAKAEYGIDKTQVSRFIRINDKFAEGGYSPNLLEQYSAFGSSKLTLMLSLPEEINNLITPDMTKAEIQTIKDEVDEEHKVSDMDLYFERMNASRSETLADKLIKQMFHDWPKMYLDSFGATLEEIQSVWMASDTSIYSVRVAGEGRYMVKLLPERIEAVNVRMNESKVLTWDEVFMAMTDFCSFGENAKGAWMNNFEEAFPSMEKPEVAPVQQTRVNVPKPETKKAEPKPVKKEEPKAEPKPEPVEEPEEDTEFSMPEPVETVKVEEEDIEVVEEDEEEGPDKAAELFGLLSRACEALLYAVHDHNMDEARQQIGNIGDVFQMILREEET